MGSRSRAVALVVLVAACASAVAVRAAPRGSALRVACGQKSFLVGFYPNDRPGPLAPHVRLFTLRQTLGTVFPTRVSFARPCKAVADAQTVWDGGRATTTRKTTVLRCTVPRVTLFRAAAVAGSGGYAGNRLALTLGRTRKAFLRALVATTGSSLRYDPRYCKKR